MGLLVDGQWCDDSFDKARMEGGRFNRPTTKFRNWVTPDGSPGPTGAGDFAAESGRTLRVRDYLTFCASQTGGLITNTATVFLGSYFMPVLAAKRRDLKALRAG